MIIELSDEDMQTLRHCVEMGIASQCELLDGHTLHGKPIAGWEQHYDCLKRFESVQKKINKQAKRKEQRTK